MGSLHSVYSISIKEIVGGYIEFLVVSVPHLFSPGTIMWQINAYSCKELWRYFITMFGWLVQFLIVTLQPDVAVEVRVGDSCGVHTPIIKNNVSVRFA